MNDKQSKKIWNGIYGTLQHCTFSEGQWACEISDFRHLRSLAEKIISVKGEWITQTGVFEVFFRVVDDWKHEKMGDEAANLDGHLTDFFGEDTIKWLADSILEYFQSIPRKYEIRFPLSSLDIPFEPVELCQNVWVKGQQNTQGTRSEFTASLLVTGREKVCLCFQKEGYINYLPEDNICFQEALSNFKQILFSGMQIGLLGKETYSSRQYGMDLNWNHVVPKYSASITDLDDNRELSFDVVVPIRLASFFNELSFDFDILNKNEELSQGAKEKIFLALFVANLKKMAVMGQGDDNSAAPITSAAEWAIDAQMEENETLSFLHICLGLECLLGADMDKGVPMTRTLADRCAYLLGTNTVERSQIREKFLALYNERSNLVHGRAIRINSKKRELLDFGRTVLENAIMKELKNYKPE